MTVQQLGVSRLAFGFWGLMIVVLAMVPPAMAGDPSVADPDPQRFEKAIAGFESWDRKNSVPAGAVLFVGSSSIRMWETHVSFPHLPVINRGFGGSHISDVNHFAARIVLPYEPPVIVFYAGDNDIAAGKTAARVLGDCRQFVKLVHERLPRTRIIFIPIKPSLSRWEFWPEMRKANALIEAHAGTDERLVYVDLATPMLDEDGCPREALFIKDGLHLSAAGYQLWTKALTPVVEQCLASRRTDGTGAEER